MQVDWKPGRVHQEVTSKEGQGHTWGGAPAFRDWGAEGEPELRAKIESERQGRSGRWVGLPVLPSCKELGAPDPKTDDGLCVCLYLQGHRPSEGWGGLNSLSFHGVPGRAELTPWSPRAYEIVSLQVWLSWPGEHPAPWAACHGVEAYPWPQVGTTWAPSRIRRSSAHLPARVHASSSSGSTCCPGTPGLLSTHSLADSLQKHLRNRQ